MNQRLPALTARDVIRALERAGFVVSRMSGSHCRLTHGSDPARKVTVPVHSGDLKRGTLREIVAQAALLNDIVAEMGKGFNPERFVPYVVMHEFEGLLLAIVRHSLGQ